MLTGEQQLIQYVTTNEFLMASDGSVKGPKASFGWVLSTPKGTRLARCSGPAYGLKPTSYRAEGYGILSCCRFLHHLHKLSSTATKPFTLYCDNKSMVQKTNQSPTNLDDIWPNSTLESDWDILAEIWQSLLEMDEDSRPNIVHIKGHQDKKKSYNDLNLPAQLNVDADKLADQYITTHHNTNYREVPILPTCGAQLHLPEGTATHKYKRELWLARTTGPLQQKLMQRNNWTEDTFEDIDWEAYRRALNRHDKHRTSLIKYHHGILPVGKRANQYDNKYPATRPSCIAPLETQEHLHRCPSRHQWRTKCLQDIRTKLIKLDTHPEMVDLFSAGLAAVLQGETSDTIQVPQGMEEIAEAQAAIGWDQILKGRIAMGWSVHQD